MKAKVIYFLVVILLLSILQSSVAHAADTFKFPSTMDAGIGYGQYVGTSVGIDPYAPDIRFSYASNSYAANADTGYFFFGNYENSLNGATANQLVSAKLVITWQSGFLCTNTFITPIVIGSSWSEGSISSASRPQEVSSDIVGVAPTLVVNAKYYADVTSSVRQHLTGTQDFGFALRRSGNRSGDYCQGGDYARYFARESGDVSTRPYLEVVVDFSRPAFPIPTDPPSGLVLTAQTKAVLLSWNAVPVNTLSINVEFTCSISGTQTVVVASTAKQAVRTGLSSGERCTARASSSNAAGMSAYSMSTSQVLVTGTGPTTAPNSVLGINGGTATVIFSNVTSDVAEILVTLSCSASGQQTSTIAASQVQANFTGIREGETCSAYAQSKNQWGSSPLGPASNSVMLKGNVPGAMSFTSDSPQQGTVRIVWTILPQGATAVDASISCQQSGQFSRTLSTSDRSVTFSNLSSNDSCTPSVGASNQWGSSAKASNAAVTVRGAAPAVPRITSFSSTVPEEFLVIFSAPADADTIDVVITCDSIGTKTFSNIKVSDNQQNFTSARAGEKCFAAVLARNSWGASGLSAIAGPVVIKGKAPTQAPSGVSVTPGTGQVVVSWLSVPEGVQVEVTAFCTSSGQQKAVVSGSQFRYVFSAVGGEICSASIASKNDWGLSTASERTKSVVIAKTVLQPNSKASPKATATPKPSITPKVTNTPSSKLSGTESKTTLICIKGSQIKKVTAVNPKCPAGWIKKPTILKQN